MTTIPDLLWQIGLTLLFVGALGFAAILLACALHYGFPGRDEEK